MNRHARNLTLSCSEYSEQSLNVVIVGDGYTAAELGGFRSDFEAAKRMILRTPPFDRMINCIRPIDFVSKQSSAYRSARKRRIASCFGAHFDEQNAHLLVLDEAKLCAEVHAAASHWRNYKNYKIVVLVNAPETFGGGGKCLSNGDGAATGIAIASNANGCATLLHELGHSFGLADEYSGSPEMAEMDDPPPNSATDPHGLPLFWQERLTKGTLLPTESNDREVVGAFPDTATCASARHRGPAHFRPQYSCIMRTASFLDSYCKVCADWIQATPDKTAPRSRKAAQ